MEERGTSSCQKFATLFHPLFLPLSTGPRPGCFWIQRAERRNQRSSVCVDDSLDNQLVSKLPDGRPAVEQNWKFSLPSPSSSLFDAVRALLPYARSRARTRDDSRSILEECSSFAIDRDMISFLIFVAWRNIVDYSCNFKIFFEKKKKKENIRTR